MQRPVRFLVNPAAGGGRALRALEKVEATAGRLNVEMQVSAGGADLETQARRAVEEGAERLVVIGGDGSVHLALQALAETDCELAVVPTGRGDDFAATLGVPAEIDSALRLAVEGTSRPIDLLQVNRSGAEVVWAGVYAGMGFDSAVTRTANRQPRWIPRALTYNLAAVRTLIGFEAAFATVECDADIQRRDVLFVTACNAPRYGGGILIAPEASMDNGAFDLVTVEPISKPALLALLPKAYGGGHVSHPAVSIVRCRRARVRFESSVLLASDGELEGETHCDSVEIVAVPKALRVVTPPRGAC